MEMIVCPHCGSLQRQTADLGAQLQCESCYKPFIVAPEEAEAPAPAPAFSGATPVAPGNIAHRVASTLGVQGADGASGSRYKSGLLVANIVLVVGWLLAIVGILTILTSFTAQLRICRHSDYRHCCIGGRHGGRAAGTRLPRRDAHR